MRSFVILIVALLGVRVFAMTDECARWISSTTSAAGKVRIYDDGFIRPLKDFTVQADTDKLYKADKIIGLNRVHEEQVVIYKDHQDITAIMVKFQDGTTEMTTMKNKNGECFPKALTSQSKGGSRKLVWDVDMCGEIKDQLSKNPKDSPELLAIMEKYRESNKVNERVKNTLDTAKEYLNICEREVFSRFGEKSHEAAKGKSRGYAR